MPSAWFIWYLLYSKNRHGATPGRAFPHLAYVGTREMPFCNLYASKGGTFERENCAPKRPARFRGLDLASAISSAPETITRPFLTAARMYILAKPVSLWTKWTAKTRKLTSIGTRLRNFRRQNKQKPRSRWAGGSKSMAVKPTDDSADQKQKRNKKENQDR